LVPKGPPEQRSLVLLEYVAIWVIKLNGLIKEDGMSLLSFSLRMIV